MVTANGWRLGRLSRALPLALLISVSLAGVCQVVPQWQSQIRVYVADQKMDSALAVAEEQIAQNPADLEAHGWRGRLLAWTGKWADAEIEYRLVLERAPNDTDIRSGLADVLLWQGKPQPALSELDQARRLAPHDCEVLQRRARALRALGRTQELREQYRELLAVDPKNAEAKAGLQSLKGEDHHELRIGTDIDTFNYTDAAATESVILSSRWTPRWSSELGSSFYQRFGQDAGKFSGSTSFRFTGRDWLTAGGAAGHDNAVIPRGEAFVGYGHGLHFKNAWIRGAELTYQQHWLWYPGAHVLSLNFSQLYYLAKDWTWSLTTTGARSGFSGSGVDWVPSGSTRLGFPLVRGLSGNVSFGVGSEDFAQVDQIGRFSARTYAGGLKYRFAANQDVSGYIAMQDRSNGREQRSFGLSYGIHF